LQQKRDQQNDNDLGCVVPNKAHQVVMPAGAQLAETLIFLSGGSRCEEQHHCSSMAQTTCRGKP
jgi:hypothetical protein